MESITVQWTGHWLGRWETRSPSSSATIPGWVTWLLVIFLHFLVTRSCTLLPAHTFPTLWMPRKNENITPSGSRLLEDELWSCSSSGTDGMQVSVSVWGMMSEEEWKKNNAVWANPFRQAGSTPNLPHLLFHWCGLSWDPRRLVPAPPSSTPLAVSRIIPQGRLHVCRVSVFDDVFNCGCHSSQS